MKTGTRSKLVTAILVAMIIILLGSIFYITQMIAGEENKGQSQTTLAVKKTKASNVTYSKLIALNQTTEPTPTEIVVTPTVEISPTEDIAATPTEIILSYDTSSSEESSISGTVSTIVSPTKVESLPETGFINNALIMFAVASLLIFVSFIF